MLVLGYHHPLAIVKRYGTLDRVSNGRLVLGVGVGSLVEEFELLDAPFSDRGARADDAIRALRASFGRAEPVYRGTHYEFDDFVIDPTATTTDVPIWIGGQSPRSLRRAVELGDAWTPFALNREDVSTLVAQARETDAWAARTTPLEVILQPVPPFDPLGAPDDTRARIERLVAAGATGLALRFQPPLARALRRAARGDARSRRELTYRALSTSCVWRATIRSSFVCTTRTVHAAPSALMTSSPSALRDASSTIPRCSSPER